MKPIRLALALAAVLSLQGCSTIMAMFYTGGLLAAIAIPSMEKTRENSKEATMRANGNTVMLGLEQFATDSGGKYPDNLMDMVGHKNNYMPRKLMPPSPWGGKWRQGNNLTLADAPVKLNGPNDEDGPSAVGTVLGPGKAPTSKAFDATTYGAILYGHDPKEETYVLYGIGERDGKAVVVFSRSNNN